MKKLSKISFKNTLNEEQMKHVVGGAINPNVSCIGSLPNCDGVCGPNVSSTGVISSQKCKMGYIKGLGGGQLAACICG